MRPGDPPQQVEDRQRRPRRSTPYSTPTASTAAVVASASSSSLRRNRGQPPELRRRRSAGSRRTRRRRRARRSGRRPAAARGTAGRSTIVTARRRGEYELGAAADRVADRRAAAAAADREAENKPAPRLAAPSASNSWRASIRSRRRVANARAGQHVVGVGDEGDTERRRQQGAQVDGGKVRNRGWRQPARDTADGLDPHLVQIEHGDRDGGQDHRRSADRAIAAEHR